MLVNTHLYIYMSSSYTMPNKRAKERKRKRRLKNTELNRTGRTANQVRRKRKILNAKKMQ